ncbi:hypothetical protein LOTGIDRAFT_174669 [Lottia gigantea]|uniref:Uncharacterized protein n=1 Tax=Lottia gigantea TaxID=225164 RepID=V3ZZT2_LOTGI|nr:hypothetical protein LOTGIDRAFT_174669 [Lottia gigantea]ESO97063.1 hypothetical protein LOTGIDRAFT_174669 [Lottia gigantea]
MEPFSPTDALQPFVTVHESEAAYLPEYLSITETLKAEEAEISPKIMPEKSDLNLTELEEFVKKTKLNGGFDPLHKAPVPEQIALFLLPCLHISSIPKHNYYTKRSISTSRLIYALTQVFCV